MNSSGKDSYLNEVISSVSLISSCTIALESHIYLFSMTNLNCCTPSKFTFLQAKYKQVGVEANGGCKKEVQALREISLYIYKVIQNQKPTSDLKQNN